MMYDDVYYSRISVYNTIVNDNKSLIQLIMLNKLNPCTHCMLFACFQVC